MIRAADIRDVAVLVDFASRLWPGNAKEDIQSEFIRACTLPSFQFFLAIEDLRPVGFIQLSTRKDYVEGSDSTPVGYVEGIYVEPSWRQKGIGKQLLREAETWCKANGLSELGSDTEWGNTSSQEFHKRCGFLVAERVVHFIKRVSP